MRTRVWVLLAAVAAGLLFGFLGRGLEQGWAEVVAGFAFLVALLLGLSLLPFWRRVLLPVPPMPGLFDPVGADQRWCVHCGNPAPADARCTVCGQSPPVHSKS